MIFASKTARRSLPRYAAPSLAALRQVLARWSARRRDRQALARLDPHLLRDIGLDAGHAALEAARPFWKA